MPKGKVKQAHRTDYCKSVSLFSAPSNPFTLSFAVAYTIIFHISRFFSYMFSCYSSTLSFLQIMSTPFLLKVKLSSFRKVFSYCLELG